MNRDGGIAHTLGRRDENIILREERKDKDTIHTDKGTKGLKKER